MTPATGCGVGSSLNKSKMDKKLSEKHQQQRQSSLEGSGKKAPTNDDDKKKNDGMENFVPTKSNSSNNRNELLGCVETKSETKPETSSSSSSSLISSTKVNRSAQNKSNVNPFACFAYKETTTGGVANNDVAAVANESAQDLIAKAKAIVKAKKWNIVKSTTTTKQSKKNGKTRTASSTSTKTESTRKAKKLKPSTNDGNDDGTTKDTKKKGKKKKENQHVSMKSLSRDEQVRITAKWHSMVPDFDATIEEQRFQVLVAARLHARCHETCVRTAMKTLHEKAFPQTSSTTGTSSSSSMFTVQNVANIDPEKFAQHITNLQFYNVKAKQIVKAANEIVQQFNGIVPEDEPSLLKITGVGKVFAGLLAFVNTRQVHEERKRQEEAVSLRNDEREEGKVILSSEIETPTKNDVQEQQKESINDEDPSSSSILLKEE